ncbi:MAG: hypothetical protein WDW38_008927 [Sanguina aurantia]
MDSMRHALHSIFKATAESVLPPLATSQFEEKRVLTPQEFVITGDYLVRACPTWSWEGGDAKKRKPYLPADKQFLITRNVPCMRRATDIDNYDPNSEFVLEGDEEGWVATHNDPAVARPAGTDKDDDIPEMDGPEASAAVKQGGIDDDDDIPDIGSLEMEEEEDEVMEDVSEEHARKTITVDPHPHLPVSAASIHPCRHAEVMKKFVDRLQEAGRSFALEQYLVLFLKFIASVVPTIQYDYTMSVGNE